ncbi:CDP-glycerol glycerophosphotransferase family protein [Candidatus Galacturonibacter soehngenii]|uniref:CDP-glycerol glycerophosphotransferase family protein n=1 Tax=Candidatus Galacturonatibacter soehngenii TaxID=2307010 RepID=A0A7V7UG90_9FIRM|nr:CDP-glycerol glycerophosphotransferase family protein [Candidatus Galacturonibacter soehngenii]KAB1438251.1 hypothetical protein F7O84_11920 [Candidatus Galacturonibacter soehngenii]
MSKVGRTISEGQFLKTIFKKPLAYADRALANIYNYFKFWHKPINNHKIMMLTSRGSYNCHPRAIADEIIRQKLPYEIVWVVRTENIESKENFPKNVKIILRGSKEFYEEAATSKVWIDNSVTFSYLFAKKRKEQVLIQTWHGTFGLKKFDETVNNNKYWIKKAYQEGAQTDYCLTNCLFEEELFRSTFWKNAEMLPYGHPRNDILFKSDTIEVKQLVHDIRKRYRLNNEERVLLYAPTFREEQNSDLYELPYEDVIKALEERFGGKWVIMVRYHFMDRKLKSLDAGNPYVINATEYPDIQDLMLLADIGVTDYSSWIYDYFFTKKPGFLYVPDIEEYTKKDREFLFPIEITPFPIAKNQRELCDQIACFDEKKYDIDYQRFYQEMNCYEDGHAAERVVDKLKEIMG